MTVSQYQWLQCSKIANSCAAQFVGRNNTLAAMLCQIAISFQIQAGAWK